MTKIIVFGDLHLNYPALGIILEYAKKEGIRVAINLGDEATLFTERGNKTLDALYEIVRMWAKDKGNRYIGVVGNTTAGVPKDLNDNYMNFFVEENIIAGHDGSVIQEKFKDRLEKYRGEKPLVVLHGHSHSMGVLEEYKYLKNKEIVRHLNRDEVHNLEGGKVYWVNPGSSSGGNLTVVAENRTDYANFAVYDDEEQTVTLKSIQFEYVQTAYEIQDGVI